MMVGIGLCCLLMAGLLLGIDPLDFHPDPLLQALVWIGFGVACFVAAWRAIQRDHQRTAYFYEKLAAHEDAYSMYWLGDMYSKGRGVPKDYVLAHMWFSLAAERGKPDGGAAGARDALTTKMTPKEISEARRLAREWQPKQEPQFVELSRGW
jgi:hypothetical protein